MSETRIMAIRIQDFCGIRFFEWIGVPEDIAEVCGYNGQGKTSFLKAINTALGGKGAICEKPIRGGAKESEIYIDLGTVEVTCKLRKDKKPILKVTKKDTGDPIPAQQTFLNSLLSKLAFDPLKYLDYDLEAQGQLLKDLAGPEYVKKLTELNVRIGDLEDERRIVNRKIKQFGKIKPVEKCELPDLETLYAMKNRAERERDLIEKESQLVNDIICLGEELTNLYKDLGALDEHENYNLFLPVDEDKATKHVNLLRLKHGFDGSNEDVLRDINEQIMSSKEQTEKYKRYEEYCKRSSDLKKLTAESAKMDSKLEKLRDERNEHIKSVDLPDGLEFKDTGLYYDDKPIAQLSKSEKIKLGVKIGSILSPELKLFLVDDGEGLDDLDELKQLHKQYGTQFIVATRGGEGHLENSILIEMGERADEF